MRTSTQYQPITTQFSLKYYKMKDKRTFNNKIIVQNKNKLKT